MSSKEQKFSRNRRFLPTGERKFPKNGQFYASRRTKIFRESPFFANRRTKISQKRPFLCQPKEKNFARKAIFVPAERRKFPRNSQFYASRRTKISRERPFFLPTGGQEFPENGQFCASRKTKKMNPTTIFLRPAGKSRPKFLPRKAGNPKKISGKTGNGTTCPQTEPGFFHAAGQMTSRKSRIAGTFLHRTARIFYVPLPGNVRSTRRKPTFPDRKTYGLHTGNIENIKKKKGYPADTFRIRNTEETNGPFTGKEQKSRIRKNRGNSLRENLQKTRKIKAD